MLLGREFEAGPTISTTGSLLDVSDVVSRLGEFVVVEEVAGWMRGRDAWVLGISVDLVAAFR